MAACCRVKYNNSGIPFKVHYNQRRYLKNKDDNDSTDAPEKVEDYFPKRYITYRPTSDLASLGAALWLAIG